MATERTQVRSRYLLKNIEISVSSTSSYVGGLAGYSTGAISNIMAEGDAVDYTPLDGLHRTHSLPNDRCAVQ
ncbi:MAG: GLUG motif-containing protein [Pilosibacter sp.]